ncbi:MAG: 7-carboxy-7-deazaguanine synthase QueE, partial [Desulfurobacteriaceae bacterium]
MRICETFISIQGEGLTVGTPAFFIRTGRCSVGCRFCDTAYSWNSGKEIPVGELILSASGSPVPTVVVTGGEPLEEEDLPLLLNGLLEAGRRVILETCGHFFRDDLPEGVRIVLSPKPPTMGVSFPEESVLSFLKSYRQVELKFTLFNEEDLRLIKNFLKKNSVLIPRPVVFQPLHLPTEDYSDTCRRVVEMV